MNKNQKLKLYEELLQTMAIYNLLLAKELESCQGIAWAHGWRSTEEKIKAGIDLRKKVIELTQKLCWEMPKVKENEFNKP